MTELRRRKLNRDRKNKMTESSLILVFTGMSIVPIESLKGVTVEHITDTDDDWKVCTRNEIYFDGTGKECTDYLSLLFDCITAARGNSLKDLQSSKEAIQKFVQEKLAKALEEERTRSVDDNNNNNRIK